MNNIKIRVWDKEENKMISGDSFAFEEYAPLNDLFHNNSKRFDFMLCIGCEDLEGKEIYEGDIVERTNLIPSERFYGKKEIGIVEYKNSQFMIKTGQGEYYGIGDNGIFFFFASMAEHKIIGNIYQNPELLEREK